MRYHFLAECQRPDVLACYDCDPSNLVVHNSNGPSMTKMSCLTDENDPGELKQCSLLNGLCAKGTMGK